jgi:hypothetical protein
MKKILAFLCLFAGLAVTMNAATSSRICLQHVYQWQESATGAMTVSEGDPYYVGGWTTTLTTGATASDVTVVGGLTPYHLSQPLKVNQSTGRVTLEVGGDEPFATVTGGETIVAAGTTTQVDSVSRYYVVNEEWLTSNADLADVTGEMLADGTIHIAGGFAYYVETTITRTVTNEDGSSRSYTDETVSTSPIYRDTWLMVPNGKHEFINEADGTTSTVDVCIRQSGDTVWVTNVYGYGAPEVYMLLDAEGTMTYPSQMLRDIPAEMSATGNGVWVNKDGNTGAVTTTAITWGQTTPSDGARTWDGWTDNRLYYTDGTEFVIPGSEPQGLRGDVNNDGGVNISDVTTLINHLLSGDTTSGDGYSHDNADCNLDGGVNISDVTTLINYLLSNNWPN